MTSTSAEAAEETRKAWEQVAAGYDDFVTPTHLGIAEQGLRQVRVGPGTKLLDVAAGSGALAVTAARLGADVLAVDLAPTMLTRLRGRAGPRPQPIPQKTRSTTIRARRVTRR